MGPDDNYNGGIRPQPEVDRLFRIDLSIFSQYHVVYRSFFGKFIAGFCALSGVFILTLPIPIVVNSFANFYKNRLWRNEVELRKQERLRLKAIQERQTQKYQFIEVEKRF